jgi:hypothetical protein
MSLSLVTYTYNDHEFVHELLRTAVASVRPDEIIVVDDFSLTPFSPKPGVTVLRPRRNLGPAGAKRLGLEAAGGDVVLSVDCDIRFHRRWLHTALPLLAEPDVALVGASIMPALADNFLSRALHKTSSIIRQNRRGAFLPGGLWLFRKELWRSLRGFEGQNTRTHEDAWFCHKVTSAGGICIAADHWPVYETRRLHRVQYWRRMVAYLLATRRAEISGEALEMRSSLRLTLRRLDEQAAAALRGILEKSLNYGQSSGEWAFCYIELVKCCVLLAESLGEEEEPRGSVFDAPYAGQVVLGGIAAFFRGYPALLSLLREDFAALPLPEEAACPFLDRLLSTTLPRSVLEEIDRVWIEKLRREDACKSFDAHWLTTLRV